MNSRRKTQNQFSEIDLEQSIHQQPDLGNISTRY
jgi:hypothetical protein